MATVDLAVEASVNPGERRPQELMELPKGRCVTGSVGPGRDRAEPERSGQPFLEAPERLDGVNLVDLNLFVEKAITFQMTVPIKAVNTAAISHPSTLTRPLKGYGL